MAKQPFRPINHPGMEVHFTGPFNEAAISVEAEKAQEMGRIHLLKMQRDKLIKKLEQNADEIDRWHAAHPEVERPGWLYVDSILKKSI